jgi:hypothetical protein
MKLYSWYYFSYDGKSWEYLQLTRVDRHIYPYCADYRRFKHARKEAKLR